MVSLVTTVGESTRMCSSWSRVTAYASRSSRLPESHLKQVWIAWSALGPIGPETGVADFRSEIHPAETPDVSVRWFHFS